MVKPVRLSLGRAYTFVHVLKTDASLSASTHRRTTLTARPKRKKAALACRLCCMTAHGDRPLRRDTVQRDIMFMLTLCITHSVPTIRIAAVSTV